MLAPACRSGLPGTTHLLTHTRHRTMPLSSPDFMTGLRMARSHGTKGVSIIFLTGFSSLVRSFCSDFFLTLVNHKHDMRWIRLQDSTIGYDFARFAHEYIWYCRWRAGVKGATPLAQVSVGDENKRRCRWVTIPIVGVSALRDFVPEIWRRWLSDGRSGVQPAKNFSLWPKVLFSATGANRKSNCR